ncbi:hypothetical protein [Microcoleus sp. PH2017_02_FOX_O_A]|uniref:hypothetical protein n=1 Tax=Microcoleus sp. PH2017_02_FOX_O_A TaxID=2798813 RepID=UPI001DBE139A|nr:hypothetical protein [Microcoleus sp. PH2017_02_FOX_O_A]MCC3416325.1 hypothetical protein [Microcoleus sp. PH2017_02_FOX_O_A]
MLAAAAGDDRCIQQVYNTLASYTWQSNYPELIAYAEWRVFSISISQPELLKELLAGWERKPDNNNFENPNNCTAHIYIAGHTARNFFKTQQLDPTAEPWSWEEYGSKELVPKNLINRPLKETMLTLANIQKSVEVNGYALKALRTQPVKIDLTVFEHYSQLIDSIPYYALTLLIELSRKTDFRSDIWIENVLRVFPKIQDPIELMYITGGLLNPQWQIPSWRS